MKRFLKILATLILILNFNQLANAKPLPPGSGEGDVPANILILLDSSISMNNKIGDGLPSVFYMATGFHGFHVIVGTIFLAVCLWRGKLGHFNKDHHFGFEAAAWYWHFVDVVWLFLFAAIYIWGS